MRWAGRVARFEKMTNIYVMFVENPEGKNRLGDLGVNGRKILKIGPRFWRNMLLPFSGLE
jgi:hypothetical protein